jgi:hypothetical protein
MRMYGTVAVVTLITLKMLIQFTLPQYGVRTTIQAQPSRVGQETEGATCPPFEQTSHWITFIINIPPNGRLQAISKTAGIAR